MICIYCKHPKTYTLKDGLKKCSKCKRKFSPKKIEQHNLIRTYFIKGESATKTAIELKMHFLTVKKRYDIFRREVALYADEQYHKNRQHINEYDEYLYLPKTLKAFDNNLRKIQHFLTLSYKGKVYNIMMPNIEGYNYNTEDEKEKKLLSKFLRFNKAAKLKKSKNNITKFWDFFEDFILRYKGVSSEQFIYYLKEAEWRFNYTIEEKEKILS